MYPALTASELWQLYVIPGDREFVDCKLLEHIIGAELKNKWEKMSNLVTEMMAGTDPLPTDLIRKIQVRSQHQNQFKTKEAVCIVAGTMQLIILRGFKNMPWNAARKNMVEHFFSPDVLPYINPHKARKPRVSANVSIASTVEYVPVFLQTPALAHSAPSTSAPNVSAHSTPKQRNYTTVIQEAIVPKKLANNPMRIERYVADWTKPGNEVQFWKQVFKFAKHSSISVNGLVEYAKHNAKMHHKQSRKNSINFSNILVNGLAVNRGSTRSFCDNLSISMRTGNMDNLIAVIKNHLLIPGLHEHLIPGLTKIKQSTAGLLQIFTALCKPELTYSGFRLDLVSAIKVAAYLMFGITDLTGLRVDIWGDGCEIGGMEVTRITFRLLVNRGPSAQSSDAVFCFAGKSYSIM